ncbi:MAG: carbohydrate ABC transporter permease, partial [Clostridiales bacterium]|nr:carbohydrate ABC transporter permease [Clostridiales bacterium]
AKIRFRCGKHLFSLLMATMMIPFPAVMMPQYLFFSVINLRDSYLPLILPGCLGNISAMFFIIQFLKSVPNSLIESAKVEGASYFRIYWQIILPLIKGAVATQAIFWFMAIWNDLLGPILYLDTVEKYPITPLLASLNTQNNAMSQLAVIMAGSVLASLPLILIYLVFQKQIINSLSFTGGLKD